MKKSKLIITLTMWLLVVLLCFSSGSVFARNILDARLINVEIKEMDSENIKVIITTDIPVEYKYFKLNKPPLVAVNLLMTIHAGPARNLFIAKGMVRRVRSSQNRVRPDKVTRVVVDLVSEDVPYKVTKVENQIIIETGPGAKKPKREKVAQEVKKTTSTEKIAKEKVIESPPSVRAEEKVPAAPQPEEVIVEETAEKAGVITSIGIPPRTQTQDYRVGPDDVLEITVYREEELDREVRVSSDGYISFPLLGKVKAGGFTVSELENSLTERLKGYLKNPQVTAFISEYSTIAVTGQVKTPGSYPLKGELTVIEAIGMAEGFTNIAAQNEVKVMRMENGGQKTIIVKVADISKKGDKSKDVSLQRGDIVFVPESTITVTGQVKKPDSYPLKEGLTVIEAIGLAGGFTKYASRNNVKIMRIENGEKKTIRVRVADIHKKGDKVKDELLKRNDIIFVPESLF